MVIVKKCINKKSGSTGTISRSRTGKLIFYFIFNMFYFLIPESYEIISERILFK